MYINCSETSDKHIFPIYGSEVTYTASNVDRERVKMKQENKIAYSALLTNKPLSLCCILTTKLLTMAFPS